MKAAAALTFLALTLTPVAAAAPIDVRATLRPETVLFGDPVTAEVEVVMDASLVDPTSVRIDVGTAPFRRLGAAKNQRWESDGLAVIRARLQLACSSEACLPDERGRRSAPPPARVSAHRRDGRVLVTRATWTPVTVIGRVPSEALSGAPAWRFNDAPAAPSYRAPPDVLIGGLAGLSVAFGLVAVVLVAGEGLRWWRHRSAAGLPPLEAALAAVRAAVNEDEPARRRATGGLARALAGRDGRLLTEASELAWAEPSPEPARLAALVDEVERELAAR